MRRLLALVVAVLVTATSALTVASAATRTVPGSELISELTPRVAHGASEVPANWLAQTAKSPQQCGRESTATKEWNRGLFQTYNRDNRGRWAIARTCERDALRDQVVAG